MQGKTAQENYHKEDFSGGGLHSLSSLWDRKRADSVQTDQKDFCFPNLIPYPHWKKQEFHLSMTQTKERDQQRNMVSRTSPPENRSTCYVMKNSRKETQK
uniref:Uncharacterized protein n=1 Tax=Sphaerodactylus townsendi TaxID=933632 RepID=A0ACB8EEU2_9SAUR